MKRFHLHVGVKDLEKSVQFYSTLFGQAPTKLKDDYAKWMLDDPRVNFAISTRASEQGVDHLGIQVDSEGELSELTERLKKADLGVFDEGETNLLLRRIEQGLGTGPFRNRLGDLPYDGRRRGL